MYAVESWHKGKSGGQLRSITQRHSSTARTRSCPLQSRGTGISGVSLKLTVRAGGSVVDLKFGDRGSGPSLAVFPSKACDERLGIR